MANPQRPSLRPNFRPALEELEDRRLLATGIGNLLVFPKNGLIINEGSFAPVSVQLSSVPKANVIVKITSQRTADATVAPKTLVFTPANWNIAQQFNIKGVNKDIGEPLLERVGINVAATSTDQLYAGDKALVNVRIRDLGKAVFNGLYLGTLTATGRIPLTGQVGTINKDLQIQVTNGKIQVLQPSVGEVTPIAGSDTFVLNPNGTASVSFKAKATQQGVSATIQVTATLRKLPDGSCVAQGTLKSLTPAVLIIVSSSFEIKRS